MLLASALMAGAGSAFADSEVWGRVLPNDLKSADKVVIVDLTTKVAMGNDPDEGNPPYSVTVKLNDRRQWSACGSRWRECLQLYCGRGKQAFNLPPCSS